MLGTINPQTIKIDQQAVVYPNRDHVSALTVKKFDGRKYVATDLSALTRVVLAFHSTDPTIVYDSDVQPAVFSWVGSVLTVDLSAYAMPASILPCYLIAFDAEHPNGQVLVDNNDTTIEFDFRNVLIAGTTPPPAVEFVTEAPNDGQLYGRRNLGWAPIDAVDVGADPAGTGATEAASAVAAHEAAADPHPQYLTPTEGNAAYAPLSHVGAGGTAHANVVAGGAAGFMTGTDKTKLDGIAAGAQVNVPTNLTTSTSATTLTVNSDTGTDATLPAATTSVAGVMTSTDKTKLDGIASGATANSPDATLLARANHTGTQTASTISDFNSATRAQVEAELVAGTNVVITPSGTGATRQLTLSTPALPTAQVVAFAGTSKTLALTDINTIVDCTSSSAVTITIPPQSSVAWTADAEIHVRMSGTGEVSIAVGSGVTVPPLTAPLALGGQGVVVTLKRRSSDVWAVIGLTNVEAVVRATPLTGLVTTNNSAVVATDTVLVGFGKLQAQVGAMASALDTINGVVI